MTAAADAPLADDTGPTRPLDAARAKRIAQTFLPAFAFGNRYDYYYCLAKLRSDPLYPAVLAALRGSEAPVLDLGCGLGLLAHALHEDGQTLAYRGVDNDADKIARARMAADRRGLPAARFDVVDLAGGPPAHSGSVAILDVLQYLDPAAQEALLRTAAGMLTPGGRLVIRSAVEDGSRRSRTSRVTDRLANWVGWMQFRPRSYPTRESLRTPLEAAGLRVRLAPLYGRTPFNNWLLVAERD